MPTNEPIPASRLAQLAELARVERELKLIDRRPSRRRLAVRRRRLLVALELGDHIDPEVSG